MNLKECYETLGGDYENVMSRLCSEALVQKFILKFLDDRTFEDLCTAMERQQGEEAFRGAHTMKGICQNLGFTRLYESSNRLTEALRNFGISEESKEPMDQVRSDYEKTTEAIVMFRDSEEHQ